MLRIEVADLGLPALDALDVDALAVHVGPERPLQRLAGFADWRLCGAISRAIRAGLFDSDRGEALLLPSAGRMRPGRIFCFGHDAATLTPGAFTEACTRAAQAMKRAGSVAYATALPPVQGADSALPSVRTWLDAVVHHPVGRIVVLGDARALQRDLLAARQALGVDVEVVAPPSRVEMPPRPSVSPPRSAVIR